VHARAGAVCLDLRDLNAVDIRLASESGVRGLGVVGDVYGGLPGVDVAVVQAGAKLRDVDAAAGKHGLVYISGWCMHKYGCMGKYGCCSWETRTEMYACMYAYVGGCMHNNG
jgi:FAD/FMN-containing dehydrogenase